MSGDEGMLHPRMVLWSDAMTKFTRGIEMSFGGSDNMSHDLHDLVLVIPCILVLAISCGSGTLSLLYDDSETHYR